MNAVVEVLLAAGSPPSRPASGAQPDHGGRPVGALAAASRVRLCAPFDALAPEALLAHFQRRGEERYSPVPDPLETRRERIDAIVAGRFEFNGETHLLGTAPDWLVNPSADVEWHILLHKFYYATGLGMAWADTGEARYATRWVELTSSWIDAVPPDFIAADVTGRRVQNWIYAYLFFVLRGRKAPLSAAFHERLLAALDQQVEYLCANLTPKRNHRTLELYAIFLAAVAFPEFARAAEWRRFALDALVENSAADLLPDGVHCELSTDYHHLVLKNYLCVRRLAAMNAIAVPAAFDRRLAAALDFSMQVHKPDGIVPSLSDGDARGYLDLLRQGHELFGREDWLYVATGGARGTAPAEPGALFPDAGYAVLRSGWGERARAFDQEQYLVFDCGPLGEGNHGHLDCLSFEFAADGRSLVVDPGRYTYSEAGDTNWRVRFRGTAAHNTVTVDGRNQTRYAPKAVPATGTRHAPGSLRHRIGGPAPRVARHAYVSHGRFGYVAASASSAEYDAVHTRHVAWLFDEYWLVVDRLEAPTVHRYEQRFQLDERAEGQATVGVRESTCHVRSPGLVLGFDATASGMPTLEAGSVSYEYGERHAAPRVCVAREAACTWLHAVMWARPGNEAPAWSLRAYPLARGLDAPECDALVLELRRDGMRGEARDLVVVGSPSQLAGTGPGALAAGVATPGIDARRVDAGGRVVLHWRQRWSVAR